jgi:hypothetical protein
VEKGDVKRGGEGGIQKEVEKAGSRKGCGKWDSERGEGSEIGNEMRKSRFEKRWRRRDSEREAEGRI